MQIALWLLVFLVVAVSGIMWLDRMPTGYYDQSYFDDDPYDADEEFELTEEINE